MQYILNDQSEGIDFGRYLAYWESVRDRLPAHIYAFASNSDHFKLRSRNSLHDARLEDSAV